MAACHGRDDCQQPTILAAHCCTAQVLVPRLNTSVPSKHGSGHTGCTAHHAGAILSAALPQAMHKTGSAVCQPPTSFHRSAAKPLLHTHTRAVQPSCSKSHPTTTTSTPTMSQLPKTSVADATPRQALAAPALLSWLFTTTVQTQTASVGPFSNCYKERWSLDAGRRRPTSTGPGVSACRQCSVLHLYTTGTCKQAGVAELQRMQNHSCHLHA